MFEGFKGVIQAIYINVVMATPDAMRFVQPAVDILM